MDAIGNLRGLLLENKDIARFATILRQAYEADQIELLIDYLEQRAGAATRTETLVIPGRFPGMNEVVASARRNRFLGAQQKREHTARVGWLAKESGIPPFEGPVEIRFKFIEPNRRRDLDNILAGAVKFSLDGLIEAKTIVSDSQKYVKSLGFELGTPDKANSRVIIQISDLLPSLPF